MAALPGQEVILIGGLRVGIPRRDHHPFHTQVHHLIKKQPIPCRIGIGEERGIGRDPKPRLPRSPDGRNRHVVDSLAADRLVMFLARPVEMHRKRQIGGRLEPRQHLLEFERVGAEVEVFAPGHDPRHDFLNLRVEQRFAARNGNHRSTALIHCAEALLGCEVRAENLRGLLNLAAPSAGEIAAKERLQHQHQRIPVVAPHPLRQHMPHNGDHLSDRHTHATCSLEPFTLPTIKGPVVTRLPETSVAICVADHQRDSAINGK